MSNILTRVQGSKDLIARTGIGSEVVINDFDSKYPFNGIYSYVDETGEKWVRIPKFYSYYETDEEGNITGRQLSQYKVDKTTWFLNPKFIDAEGNEKPYIEVSAYLCSVEDGKLVAKEGLTPLNGLSYNITTARALAKNKSNDSYSYQLMDYWTWQLLQDLFTVEFANTDCTEIMYGYAISDNVRLVNGSCDQIGSSSGKPYDNESKSGMLYRGIENLYGNGRMFIDGIKFVNNIIYLSDDAYNSEPTYYSTNYSKPIVSGTIKKMHYDSIYHFAFPSEISTNTEQIGAYTQYFNSIDNEGETCLYSSGGLYAYYTNDTVSQTNANNAFRLVRIPKN